MSTVIFMFYGIALIVGIVVVLDHFADRKSRRSPKK